MSFTFSFHSNIIHKLKIALFNCGGSLSNDLTQKKIFLQINVLLLLQKEIFAIAQLQLIRPMSKQSIKKTLSNIMLENTRLKKKYQSLKF